MFSFSDYTIKSSLRGNARCWSDWVHKTVMNFQHLNRNLVLFTAAKLGLVKYSSKRSHKEVIYTNATTSYVLFKHVRAKNSSLTTS